MGRYGKGTFGSGVEINAQVVNGKCPFCTASSIFVSIHKTIFRCITCGGCNIVITDTRDLNKNG